MLKVNKLTDKYIDDLSKLLTPAMFTNVIAAIHLASLETYINKTCNSDLEKLDKIEIFVAEFADALKSEVFGD